MLKPFKLYLNLFDLIAHRSVLSSEIFVMVNSNIYLVIDVSISDAYSQIVRSIG